MRFAQIVLPILVFALSTPSFAKQTWEKVNSDDGLTLYRRDKAGSDIKELKAVKVIARPALPLFRTVSDLGHFADFMPYVKISRIDKHEGGKVVYNYQRLGLPLISDRDYYIRVQDVSTPAYYKSEWHSAKGGPKSGDGVERVKVNDGYWRFDPLPGGQKTRVTYYVYTDPGGMIPSFLANKANTQTIPELFAAVEKRSGLKQYQAAPAPAQTAAPATKDPAPAAQKTP